MSREVGVFLITGFMDSGKTTLIHETIFEQGFGQGSKTLLLVCEDGEVSYDEEKFKRADVSLVWITKKEEFTAERMKQLDTEYLPDQVMIEYNGTWELSLLLESDMPKSWVLYQSLATVDASTYELYYANMRQMIMEQLSRADVVIFNRCTDETPKAKFRRTIKGINRAAQLVYEREDGTIDEGADEELPYDINQDLLDLPDSDYGIWYLDVMDHPKNYEKKKVRFLALIYNPDQYRGKGMFVPGRFVMNCCAADTQFIGLKCKYEKADELAHKSWKWVTAEIRVEFAKEYKGKGPVLYACEISDAEAPEDPYVYFT